MPCALQVISSTLVENKVYITGFATDKDSVSRQVQVYSLDEAKWSTLPEAPNYNAPAAVINGHITLIGGRDSETDDVTDVLSTWFEKECQWQQILPRMPTKRLGIGVCQHDKLLLATGGG